MAESFEDRYPNIAAWVRDGWIEIGRDDYSRSFVRVLDIGGMILGVRGEVRDGRRGVSRG